MNFYQRRLRGKTPQVLLVALVLSWGYGLYDGYFGEASEYLPDDLPESALVALDRDLRLGAALESQPEIVRRMLYHDSFARDLENSRELLEELETQELLVPEAAAALAAVEVEMGLREPGPLDPKENAGLALKLSDGKGTWWDAARARRILESRPDRGLEDGLLVQSGRDRLLVGVCVISSAAVWLLFLAGLALVPRAFRRIRGGWSRGFARDYPSRWSPSRVIAVFLAVDLLGNYFLTAAYLATFSIPTGFWFDATLDTLWRLIPPLLALAFFFGKPRHAIRSLGLDQKPDWTLVLGVLAVLQLIDLAAYSLVGDLLPPDLSGLPDLMESGWRGLVYGLFSACLMAPVAEEILYRGILLRGLERRFGFAIATAVATTAFALAHFYNVYGLFSVAIFGLSTAIVYRATRSLSTSIVLHILYNFTITLPQWLLYHSDF